MRSKIVSLLIPLVWLVVFTPCDSTVTPSPSRFVNVINQTKLIYNEELSDKEILDDLLNRQRYDKRIIPRTSGPVVVNVSVLLLSLASPDESSLKYEVEFLMRQTWTDPRLAFEAGPSHKSLNAIFHHDSIWLPDTYFIKHGDFKQLSPFNIALRVHKNGTVLYIMRRHLILWCQGNLNIFPFDDPVCTFSVESISHEQSSIVYQWSDDEGTIRKTPSLASLNAYLIHNKTTFCPDRSWRGNFSCLTVELTFTRDKPFYFTTVFIPDIFLVTSSFITFWLEWNAVPARVLIGVTTMLNFFTTSNNFRSTLPVVNNLTAMNLWDGVCMCFIYASLLEFVAVNYVGRKRPRSNSAYRRGEDTITQGCVNLTRRIRDKISRLRDSTGQQEEDPKRETEHELVPCAECAADSCCHRNPDKENRQGLGINRRDNPIHPVRIAKTIDVISRTVFPTCFAIFLIYFFANYKGTDKLF